MDHINSSSSHAAQMKSSVPSLLVERDTFVVCLLRGAGSVRERNNFINLQVAILAMRAHGITNLGTRGNEEIGSPLRQVISVGRVNSLRTRGVRKSAGILYVAI
jgi:hypothetical protein